MHTTIIAISRMANNYAVPASDSGHFFAVHLAIALGYKLPLPSSPVENVRDYYYTNCFETVNDALDKANEIRVIPLEAALHYAQQIWIYRYKMLYQPFSPEVIQTLIPAIGISENIFPQEMIQCMLKLQSGEYNAVHFGEIIRSLAE